MVRFDLLLSFSGSNLKSVNVIVTTVILFVPLNPLQYVLWQIYALISRPQTSCKFKIFLKCLLLFHDLDCGFIYSVSTREMETSSFNFIHAFSYKLLPLTVIDWRQLKLIEFGIWSNSVQKARVCNTHGSVPDCSNAVHRDLPLLTLTNVAGQKTRMKSSRSQNSHI